ncbi:MAG: glycosyltransferase family 2 protein [Methyloligellaceae bacterium]
MDNFSLKQVERKTLTCSSGNTKLPKVGIIITHYNYSDFVERAINSALAQTYSNFEIILVDDCSNEEHRQNILELSSIAEKKIQHIMLEKNVGQLLAFYAGVEKIDADFYCLLDPDDQYVPTFLEEMLAVHLNPYRYVSMVCSNQMFTADGRKITSTVVLNRSMTEFSPEAGFAYKARYCDWRDGRWPWSSTSSMMFRRDAVQVLKPVHKNDIKAFADAYLATGCRYMGGTIMYDKPLVQRGVHENNTFQQNYVIAHNVNPGRGNSKDLQYEMKALALLNIIENGGRELFGNKHLRKISCAEFPARRLFSIRARSKEARDLISYYEIMLTFFRSIPRQIRRKRRKAN